MLNDHFSHDIKYPERWLEFIKAKEYCVKDEMNDISKELQNYLYTNRLGLSEFSQILGVPVSTVHGWLNGVAPKDISTVKKIANLMNKSIDELCFNESPKKEYLDTDLIISIGENSFEFA